MFNYYLDRTIKELKLNQNQWLGILVLLLLVVSIQFFPNPITFEREIPLKFQKRVSTPKKEEFHPNYKIQLKNFDPNNLDKMDWQNLGFSQKQAQSILKYKKLVGGKFTSKEQIQKCFVISEEKFNELSPFILLPNVSQKISEQNFPIQKKPIHKKFNPNELDEMGWQKLGFSQKQAASIVKYKNRVGGEFTSKEQIQKCFVISEEKFNELSPFILLPNVSKKNTEQNLTIQEKSTHKNFNPNELDEMDWQKLGFSQKQTLTILKYKKSLGGSFTSKEQVQKCFVISQKKYKEIEPFIEFN